MGSYCISLYKTRQLLFLVVFYSKVTVHKAKGHSMYINVRVCIIITKVLVKEEFYMRSYCMYLPKSYKVETVNEGV